MSFHLEKRLIYLITRGEATDAKFSASSREILEIIKIAIEEGVDLIQLREKQLSARLLFELTAAATQLTHGSATRLLVNDRADIALAVGADGVHLTSSSLPVDVIRDNFPAGFVVGVSTHSLEEVRDAASNDADFAVFGPVFETPGKENVQGLAALSEVCKSVSPFPVIAIGGIGESNFTAILERGASGIAAIRGLNDPRSLGRICRKFRNER